MKTKQKTRLRYKEEMYTRIPATNLIVFGLYSLQQKKENCTFEKLIEECFSLFPKVFSFSRHPEWPDSLKFDRTLRKLRENGLIVGHPHTFYSLTKFGERIAKETENFLKGSFSKKIIFEKPKRDAEINWINSIKRSETFQRFLKEKKDFTITNMELRNLLHCTLETPLRIVQQNLIYTLNLAKEFGEKNLIDFLKLCQKVIDKK
jgi:hypothetical protein